MNKEMMDFEVIIMGANYAGLAAAGELRGKRVLLLDREPIGGHQASTCALWTRVIEILGAEHAILHTLDTWQVHIGDREFIFPSPAHPISVLDHSLFCTHLFSRSDAEFRQETVQSIHENEVTTNKGHYRAPLLIEALGWRGLRQRDQTPGQSYTQALETEVEVKAQDLLGNDNAFHFYFSPWRWGRGGGWAFPSGKTTRIGFAIYEDAGKLTRPLSQLLDDYGLTLSTRLYGNYIPWKINKATTEGRFIVGDAAGQCLGLSGEGIRSAIYFGIAAARCARQALDAKSTVKETLDHYENFVKAHRRYFHLFSFLQIVLPRLPGRVLQRIATDLQQRGLGTKILSWYAQLFDVSALMDSAVINHKHVIRISRKMQATRP